jgi:hypothetical protein
LPEKRVRRLGTRHFSGVFFVDHTDHQRHRGGALRAKEGMRTTVTLDPDVESMLRKEVRRRGKPFKQVLNNAIRAGLRNMRPDEKAFEPVTFDMGKPHVNLTKATSFAAVLEDEELISRHRRSR